jgi:hypothetical protein
LEFPHQGERPCRRHPGESRGPASFALKSICWEKVWIPASAGKTESLAIFRRFSHQSTLFHHPVRSGQSSPNGGCERKDLLTDKQYNPAGEAASDSDGVADLLKETFSTTADQTAVSFGISVRFALPAVTVSVAA